MYTNVETVRVSFFPFKKPCPICGAWLDCITHAHAESHGLTRDEFIERYCKPGPKVSIAAVCERNEGETAADCIVRNAQANADKWMSTNTIMRKMNISNSATRIALKKLVGEGVLECQVFRMQRGSLIPGAPNGWVEKFYRIKQDGSTVIECESAATQAEEAIPSEESEINEQNDGQ